MKFLRACAIWGRHKNLSGDTAVSCSYRPVAQGARELERGRHAIDRALLAAAIALARSPAGTRPRGHGTSGDTPVGASGADSGGACDGCG